MGPLRIVLKCYTTFRVGIPWGPFCSVLKCQRTFHAGMAQTAAQAMELQIGYISNKRIFTHSSYIAPHHGMEYSQTPILSLSLSLSLFTLYGRAWNIPQPKVKCPPCGIFHYPATYGIFQYPKYLYRVSYYPSPCEYSHGQDLGIF